MARVAPIKLGSNPKILWFDPQDIELHKDDFVVVSTVRGLEFGQMSDEIFEAEEAQVKKLKTELKPVVRRATNEDEEQAEEMRKRSEDALPFFKELAAEMNDDMHPVSVEFLLEGDKAVFYFEAEERVDFRELVRKLAAKFHVRIDMRQIGVRDEARMVGGIGHCGQELCCKRLGGEFCPVSIRMAKEQGLSLNPQKISGVCGRLMCCLRYEFDVYKECKDRAPAINARIDTPEGSAEVVAFNVPREIVTLQLQEGKQIKVPLAQMETVGKEKRPSKISREVFDQYANQNILDSEERISSPYFGNSSLNSTSSEGSQKASSQGAQAKGASSKGTPQKSQKESVKREVRKPRRRTKVSNDGKTETEQLASAASEQRSGDKKRTGKQVKRSSPRTSQNQDNRRQERKQDQNKKQQRPKNQNHTRKAEGGEERETTPSKPRPGQRSSGLRASQRNTSKGNASAKKTSESTGGSSGDSPKQESKGTTTYRKSRRRSHRANTSSSTDQSLPKGSSAKENNE